jgi:mannose-1-phosphate guanylyltransferase
VLFVKNILLCGGSGTRLWPISRKLAPKQFNPLINGESLFELTFKRNMTVCDGFIIVAGQDQYFLALDQINKLKAQVPPMILEPVGRNTAPAIALACHQMDPEELVLVTPSDHLIANLENYQKTIARAKELAQQNYLVTIGINPNYPETGYGYIQSLGEDVVSFKEKPNLATAKEYLAHKNYYWNAGIFVFKAGVFLQELKKYREDIYQTSNLKAGFDHGFMRVSLEQMQNIPADSIDYAVLEKSKLVKVVAADMGWSDVGSFDSLSENMQDDANQNHIQIGSKNTTIVGHKRIIATIDTEDLIIIDSDDALVITKKGSSQKIKELTEKVKLINPEMLNVHPTAFRPWGSYSVLAEADGYKIKTISVKPGQKLSLQKHQHRNEHWVVARGEAIVTNGEKILHLKTNESTYIPAGEVHRLENKGSTDLILIEAQIGSYVGEDDIVRLQDDYKRS